MDVVVDPVLSCKLQLRASCQALLERERGFLRLVFSRQRTPPQRQSQSLLHRQGQRLEARLVVYTERCFDGVVPLDVSMGDLDEADLPHHQE